MVGAARPRWADVLRLRGELGPLAAGRLLPSHVLVDDAHLLSREQRRHPPRAHRGRRRRPVCLVAGRLVADAIHEVTQLVDGLIVDSESLAVSEAEIVEVLPPGSSTLAHRIVEASDGTSASSPPRSTRPSAIRRPTPLRTRPALVRAAGEAALHELECVQRSVVALLARAPGIDRVMLDRLGGPSFVG